MWGCRVKLRSDDSEGEELSAGDGSGSWFSRDAAKLLDISGSEMKAYEEWVEADVAEVTEVVEVVRSRGEDRN
jgi:hypothetical protein